MTHAIQHNVTKRLDLAARPSRMYTSPASSCSTTDRPLHLRWLPCRSHDLKVTLRKYVASYPTCATRRLCCTLFGAIEVHQSHSAVCNRDAAKCMKIRPNLTGLLDLRVTFTRFEALFQFEGVLVAFPGHHKVGQCRGESSKPKYFWTVNLRLADRLTG